VRRGRGVLLAVLVVLTGAVGAGVALRHLEQRGMAAGTAPPAGMPHPGGTLAAPEPGPSTVRLAGDAATHPDAERVQRLLQKYFDAINTGDYQLWRTVVIPQWARDTGEGAWRAQYRSTLDGNIVVYRLEPRPGGGLVALISFTSLQNPADAPPELRVRCLRWWVSYPLFGQGDQLRLGPSAPSANVRVAC
jgi:hypothetical protein